MGSWDMFDAFMERNKTKEEGNGDNSTESGAHIVELDVPCRESDQRNLLRPIRNRAS
jgi:hypothetical protein